MTLYIVPQLRIIFRYQEYWPELLEEGFKKHFGDVELLRDSGYYHPDSGLFTNVEAHVELELNQILELWRTVRDGDIVFFADLDFPGFSTVWAQLIKYRRRVLVTGFLHAGSYCTGDIFEGDEAKRLLEAAMLRAVDVVFVATNYHKQKLLKAFGPVASKVKVVGFPVYLPRKYKQFYYRDWKEREFDAVFLGRRRQKGTDILEELCKALRGVRVVSTTPVKGAEHVRVEHWADYFWLLGNSKIVVSCAREETFGLAVAEAVEMGCVPVVPDRYAYVELYPEEFRYRSFQELRDKILDILSRDERPEVRVKVDWSPEKFFENVSKIIRGIWGGDS